MDRPNGFELEQLRTVTQETRGNLIQDILGHPKMSPSFDELNYMNPSKSRSTVRGHLEKLINDGIVKKLILTEDERQRDDPYIFFTLTEEGWELLKEHSLFVDEIDEIRSQYEAVNKTEFIQSCEEAPRPSDVERILSHLDDL